MTGLAARLAAASTAAGLLAAGVLLRVVNASSWPPGPWLDEAFALRAARSLPASAPLVGSVPLLPPEAGFVNFWVTTPWLRLVAAVDSVAGGGIASTRAVSIGSSVLLLLFSGLLAREATRPSWAGFLGALSLLSTSAWLLATGRWGWIAVATTALLVASAWAALVAARRGSVGFAAAAGALLGLSQYGYPSAWLLFPVPALVAGWSALGKRREEVRLALVALAAALALAAPLGLHYLGHPDRLLARPREISPLKEGAGAALGALARSAEAHVVRFLLRGDGNLRHGDPSRPVLPPAAAGLALLGAAGVLARPGRERLVLLAAVLLLAGGLLAVESPGANSFRISPAAPFLLVLAGLGLGALLGALPGRLLRQAGALVAVTLLVTALLEARAFLRWASSPELRGAFGGPERELADALAASLAGGGGADVLLDPARACRSAFVVEALLGPPGPRFRPSISLAPLGPEGIEWRFLPGREVLYAGADDSHLATVAARLGGGRVATGAELPGWGRWAVYRIPAPSARSAAERTLSAFPRLPAGAGGELRAEAEGLYTFQARGSLRATLDGINILGPGGPEGRSSAVALLASGRHRLEVEPASASARLLVVPPDGFAVRLGAPETR